VNSQNSRNWSAENPGFIQELALHDERMGVWCAISARRIIRTIFYDDTVNAARYVNNNHKPIFRGANRRRKAIRCFPTEFCNGSFGIYKFGSTAGGFR
jgi:hypothetical protein